MGDSFRADSKSRENNFNAIRFIAALAVIAGHMSILNGNAPISIASHQVQTIGVYVFFLLGGYLISKSWTKDPNPTRYVIKRFTRIWPPLAVFVILTVFLFGPILTITPSVYFNHCWDYLSNLLFNPTYALPGVFTQNYYPNAVNGSIWTLPVEMIMYAVVPLVLFLTSHIGVIKGRRLVLVILTIVSCLADVCLLGTPNLSITVYGTDFVQVAHIIPFYFIGVMLSDDWFRKYLNLPLSTLLLVAICLVPMPFVIAHTLLFFLLPYFIFSLALCDSSLHKFGSKYEISYGLYLWGFFVQQVLIMVLINLNVYIDDFILIPLSLVITSVFAWFSCVLVEKPVLNASKKLMCRITGSSMNIWGGQIK